MLKFFEDQIDVNFKILKLKIIFTLFSFYENGKYRKWFSPNNVFKAILHNIHFPQYPLSWLEGDKKV